MKTLRMRAAMTALALCAAALPLTAQTAATSFNPTGALVGNNGDQSVGWQFNVLSGITVTHLGWWDAGANGLGGSHTVGIWNPAGTLLASAVIPSGTGATLLNGFRVVSISDLFLGVGSGYIVGGYNGANSGDDLLFNLPSFSTIPQIQLVDATFSGLNGIFERPTQFSNATNGFHGPTFFVSTTVPEPGTYALVGAGMLAVGFARRRRRA